MNNIKPYFSIIIPVRQTTKYLQETKSALKNQTFKNFELIVVDDNLSGIVSPAVKRNLGAKKSRGQYLAFIDDDSYPDKHWLKNIHRQIQLHPDYAAFCGPCLTPPQDNVYQQASGLVWASYMGSGGAGTYRNSTSTKRVVDDFPSVNLIVKKSDFNSINGFNTHHWPGEDTILCLDIVSKLKKIIYYHPSIVVYHHRRQVIIPHLQQITRYAIHRGHFARIYPQTSFRVGYLIPSAFLIYIISLFMYHHSWYLIPLTIYIFLLILTLVRFLTSRKNIMTSILAIVTIPITHLYYGALFIYGFLLPRLSFVPHSVKNNQYQGG